MKGILWLGSSLDDVRAFPIDVRREAGFQLGKIQLGDDPDDWKPMGSIGVGVRELRVRDSSGAFRVVYVATIADAVYVLHAFQKKSSRTTRHDLRLAQARYRSIGSIR